MVFTGDGTAGDFFIILKCLIKQQEMEKQPNILSRFFQATIVTDKEMNDLAIHF